MDVPSDVEFKPTHENVRRSHCCLIIVRKIFRNITVEPLLLLYILSKNIHRLSVENMNLEKACLVNIGYNATVCQAMVVRDTSGYTAEQENEVQKLVSSMISYRSITSIFPIFAMIFLGALSDRTGKTKLLLLVPFIGDIISTSGLLLCTYFFMELGVEYAIFFESVPNGLSGGHQLLMVALYSFMSSICDEKTRTVRIGILSTVARSTMSLGIALSGLSYLYLGFHGVFGFSLVMLLSGIMYLIFFIEETKSTKSRRENNCSFWNCGNVVNGLKICFKSGLNSRRAKMILLLLMNIVCQSVVAAEESLLYLYARKQFGWGEVNYSFYKSLKIVFQLSGSIFMLSFFSKYLTWNDAKLALLAISSKILTSITLFSSGSVTIFYLGALSEFSVVCISFCVRSQVSKIVGPDERAQAFSVTGILEDFGSALTGPVYGMVYRETVSTIPNVLFLLSSIGLVPVFFACIALDRILCRTGKETAHD